MSRNGSGKQVAEERLSWRRRWYQTPGNWAYKLAVLTTQCDKCLKLLEGNTNKCDHVSGAAAGVLVSPHCNKRGLWQLERIQQVQQKYTSLKLTIRINHFALNSLVPVAGWCWWSGRVCSCGGWCCGALWLPRLAWTWRSRGHSRCLWVSGPLWPQASSAWLTWHSRHRKETFRLKPALTAF